MRTHTASALFALSLIAACSNTPPKAGGQAFHYIAPSELTGVYGTYALANGDIVKVSRDQGRYWADSRAAGRIEIVPLERDVFVQKGGDARFVFTRTAHTVDLTVDGAISSVKQGSGA